jgi:hypothetical protein
LEFRENIFFINCRKPRPIGLYCPRRQQEAGGKYRGGEKKAEI